MPRMPLPDARPWAAERTTPGSDRLAVRDGLPALLVLLAEFILAFTVSAGPLVMALTLLAADAYVLVLLLSGAQRTVGSPGAVPASSRHAPGPGSIPPPVATPTAGVVRQDLAWVKGTLAKPIPGQRPIFRARNRPNA